MIYRNAYSMVLMYTFFTVSAFQSLYCMDSISEKMELEDASYCFLLEAASMAKLFVGRDGDTIKRIDLTTVSAEYRPFFGFGCEPKISPQCYLNRVEKYIKCSSICYMLALIYIKRLLENSKSLYFTSNCMCYSISIFNNITFHRIVFTALVIAIKFNEDIFQTNKYYASVAGITTKELKTLEILFLKKIDFRLFVSKEVLEEYFRDLQAKYRAYKIEIEKKL